MSHPNAPHALLRAVFAMALLSLPQAVPVVSAAPSAPAAPSSRARPNWSAWRSVRYEARPLVFFHGRVDMTLKTNGTRRTLDTDTTATFLGAELARARSRTTMDAASGKTLEFYDITPERGRRYLFGDTSYTVERLKPVRGWEAPVSEWESGPKKTWAYPSGPAGGPPLAVTDYYGMILSLSRLPLRATGDVVTVWVATSHGAEAYRVSVSETRNATRRIALGPSAGSGPAPGGPVTVPVTELRLRIAPADPAKVEDGFMNMEGETEIWVESTSRTLLQVSGRIPNVPGRVDVELTGLE